MMAVNPNARPSLFVILNFNGTYMHAHHDIGFAHKRIEGMTATREEK